MSFSRVRVQDVEKISELATARGLEHVIHSFSGEGYADWATFQFTNERGRRAFENLCAENSVTVDGTQVINKMLDSVLSGKKPDKVIDEALTKGMKNAIKGPKLKCKECNLPVPKYKGRYPGKCPDCKGELEAPGSE
jgi:hypothetical protein